MTDTVKITGQLLRLSANGVGAIDVSSAPMTLPGLPEVVFFEPGEISGYQGQTIEELQGSFNLRPGKELLVDVNLDAAGQFISVQSVQLK
jgi:hypothetical protein